MDTQSQPLSDASYRIEFISPWMAELIQDDPLQEFASNKHVAFRALVFQLLQARCPWLVRILQGANAQVLAMQGRFFIALPSAPFDWIEVPELSACLQLTPWPEDGETAQ